MPSPRAWSLARESAISALSARCDCQTIALPIGAEVTAFSGRPVVEFLHGGFGGADHAGIVGRKSLALLGGHFANDCGQPIELRVGGLEAGSLPLEVCGRADLVQCSGKALGSL